MTDIASFVASSQRLTDIFGRWPSFHDAEVVEIHLSRGETSDNVDERPVVTVKLHVWETTDSVDAAGFIIRRHHTLTTLRFLGVTDFEMAGFNQQNAIFELLIALEFSDDRRNVLAVEFEPAYGAAMRFKCARAEVLGATPCTQHGFVRPTE